MTRPVSEATLSPQSTTEAEPAEWRHRVRPVGVAVWSEWRRGKANLSTGNGMEFEDQALYAAPPETTAVKVDEGLVEAATKLIAEAREQCRYPNIHFHYADGLRVMSGLARALEAALSLSTKGEGK